MPEDGVFYNRRCGNSKSCNSVPALVEGVEVAAFLFTLFEFH
jgi:hypothetical protein